MGDAHLTITIPDPSILSDGGPILRVSGLNRTAEYPAKHVSIARVGEFEDAWTFSGGLDPTVDPGLFRVHANDPWTNGMYKVIEVRFGSFDPEGQVASTEQTASFAEPLLFEVRGEGDPVRDGPALLEAYGEILKGRRARLLSGIGRLDAQESFGVFAFIQDCLITVPMHLGAYQIGPAGSLGSTTEEGVVNEFFRKHVLSNSDQTVRFSAPTGPGRPCAVIHFPVIRADTHVEATQLAGVTTQQIADVLGVLRMSYGTIFAMTTIKKSTGEVQVQWRQEPYRGNLVGGFISGEEPEHLRFAIGKTRGDARRQFFLTLLREALRKDTWESAVFGFWSLLETIARSKGYLKRPRRGWDGERKRDAHGLPLVIQGQAKELVFELLREHFAPGRLPWATPDLAQTGPEELLTIWYQRRNCVGHVGSCQPTNPEVCRKSSPTCVSCNSAREEVVSKAGNDAYLLALSHLTVDVVRRECGF